MPELPAAGLARPAARRARLVLGTGVLAVALYLALPSEAQRVAYVAIAFGAAAAAAIPSSSRRRRVPGAIGGLAAGLAAIGLGDATYTVIEATGGEPFPSLADAFYLLGYAALVVAVARLHGRRPSAGGLIDAALPTLAGGLVIWTLAVRPLLAEAGDPLSTAIALAYPAFDVVYLGLSVGLLVEPRTRSTSLGLTLLAFGLFLVADTVYAGQVLTETYEGGLLDAAWLAGYILLAAAANHPSLLVEAPVPASPAVGPWRFAGLAAAASTAPALALIEWAAGSPIDPVVASLGAGAVNLLVLVRLGLARRALTATIASLTAAHERVASLEGILPICASCKRIRDEAGRWTSVEQFLSDRSTARFSHGLCDECLDRQLRALD
ncbi:MAG TPA: hypothetical protein VNO86_02065 [Candidatus Binatia bacterium]|nr:hypothetical protein [Candidatus Binatia bacterium]